MSAEHAPAAEAANDNENSSPMKFVGDVFSPLIVFVPIVGAVAAKSEGSEGGGHDDHPAEGGGDHPTGQEADHGAGADHGAAEHGPTAHGPAEHAPEGAHDAGHPDPGHAEASAPAHANDNHEEAGAATAAHRTAA